MELLWKVGRRNDALAQYERCRQALADELDVEPEDETIELYTRIRSTGAALRRTAVNLDKGTGLGRLPAPATRLVGRRQELEDVADMLGHRDCRLLSLIGPGGSGKTRLAIQIATDQTGSFPDGVWLVRLALVRDRDGIAPAIAAELGLRMTGSNEPEQHLFDWLRDRALLLVLDNAEHLVDHMGVVSRILAASRYVKLLITSRERLRLQGEWVYDIGGLPVPTGEGTDAFEGYGAVELFCDRLRQVRPRVPLRHEERPLVAQICRMVDGMPLAIELAAAWAQTLSLEQIAEEIRRNLDFLSSSIRDVPDRHQSIRTVFDQTWNMLTEEEQTAYRRLSIFRDGFSLQAAESVTGTPSALLASLVSKSLVVHLPTERFRLHELLRHYGEERLRLDESQFLSMHRRHCDYFLEYVAEREEALTGRAQQSALADIGIEIENLQAAWRWGTQQCRVAPMSDAMHALWLFYVIRGWMREGSSLFGSLLVDLAPASSSECEDSTARTLTMANATMRFGGFQSGLGHYHEATESLANGASRLREFDAPRELGLALNMLAAVVLTTGDYQQSRSHLQESLELFRRIDDAWGIALSLNDLGLISLMVGAVDEAYASCEDSRARFRRMGDKRGQAFAASNLATIATERGDLSHARRMHHEALALRQESDDRWGVASSHAQLGTVARLANSAQEAREHFVTALRMAWDSSITPVVLETLVELSALDIDEGDLARASDTLAVVAAHPATNGSVQERIADLTGTDLLDQETLVTRMSGNRWAVQAVDDLVRALLD
jgi:predicted ATPase